MYSSFLFFLQFGGGASGDGGISFVFFILAMFGIMYVLLILPQNRKMKKHENFLANLKKGHKVITMGGIHGKVLKVSEDSVSIDIGGGTRIKVEKMMISSEMSARLNKTASTDTPVSTEEESTDKE